MTMLPFTSGAPWLAPLAGWSDLPFRLLCRALGAAVCCTEMISAKGLVYGGRNTEELLAATPEDGPLVAQIFGAEPDFMGEAVRILKDRGFVRFDVNMGCSVPKVTKTGSGSALMKNPNLALAVAGVVIKAAGPGRAGFKLRLGWETGQGPSHGNDAPPGIYLELGRNLADMGAAWLTLHPRYAKQGFRGEADHRATALLARSVPVPVLASGDLFTAADGVRILAQSGAAAAMYARGALHDPAVFLRHTALLEGRDSGRACLKPGMPEQDFRPGGNSRENLAAVIRRHAELAREFSPYTALRKMRTIVPRYVRHLDGAKTLRKRLITCTDWETLDRILEEELG